MEHWSWIESWPQEVFPKTSPKINKGLIFHLIYLSFNFVHRRNEPQIPCLSLKPPICWTLPRCGRHLWGWLLMLKLTLAVSMSIVFYWCSFSFDSIEIERERRGDKSNDSVNLWLGFKCGGATNELYVPSIPSGGWAWCSVPLSVNLYVCF